MAEIAILAGFSTDTLLTQETSQRHNSLPLNRHKLWHAVPPDLTPVAEE